MNKKGDFTHDVKTKAKPWTHLDFCGGEDSEDFNFAIVGDRSGRPEPGIFEETVEKVNLLGPDFDTIPFLVFFLNEHALYSATIKGLQ